MEIEQQVVDMVENQTDVLRSLNEITVKPVLEVECEPGYFSDPSDCDFDWSIE